MARMTDTAWFTNFKTQWRGMLFCQLVRIRLILTHVQRDLTALQLHLLLSIAAVTAAGVLVISSQSGCAARC